MALVEDVYCLSGIPNHNFVPPVRYDAMKVAVRTPGRCVIFEGPSGIGKTTVVVKILEEINKFKDTTFLSAREPGDLDLIQELPSLGSLGIVVVDDFHRLDEGVKNKLSDFMKVLADRSDPSSKLILIGINQAGIELINYANDLGMRLDRFRLESNPPEKLMELIEKGENSLNVCVADKAGIAKRSYGSFHIAQMLCHNLCVDSGVIETFESDSPKDLTLSSDVVSERTMEVLSATFQSPCMEFAGGSKIRREGRAPYLHILKWLAESDDWWIDISERMRREPTAKASVGQVVEKGFLESLLKDKKDILAPYFNYQPKTTVLSIEDPKVMFYLKNLVWRQFSKKLGYRSDFFEGDYDLALSFAGGDRAFAERLFELFSEREVAVFYDKNEQHRIIAENVEDYLAPIYRSAANYVLPLLSPEYPSKIWTKFESDQFKDRFGDGAVIPVRFRTAQPGYFSDEQKFGSVSFDPSGDVETQLREVVEIICLRLAEDRSSAAVT